MCNLKKDHILKFLVLVLDRGKRKGIMPSLILFIFLFYDFFLNFYIFLLFLKMGENNLYLSSKNNSLFSFVFKNCFETTIVKQILEFLKIENCF